MSLIQIIKSSPLFLELYDEEIEDIIKTCKVLSLDPGDVVFKEGDQGRDIFIILNGTVSVKKGAVELIKLNKGELFGELVLVNELTRTADCIAANYTEILVIHHDAIFSTYAKKPRLFSVLMMNISRLLAMRLKKTSAEMGALHQKIAELEKTKKAA